MHKKIIMIICFCILSPFALNSQPQTNNNKQWAQWRGPAMTGEALIGNPPVEWSEEKNISWKTEISGNGLSTPVIWDNQIFILTAIQTDEIVNETEEPKKEGRASRRWMRSKKPTHVQKFVVLSVNRKNGKILWERTVNERLPHEGTHGDGSWAAGSPVTDGEHLFAYFGSFGLYCFDMKGTLIWKKDFGNMRTRHSFGEGSSPALYKDKIIINWDHEGDSFITVLDKNTGKEIWKKSRNEVTSWSTPIVVNYKGSAQIIVNAADRVRGYSLDTGNDIWESSGMTVNTVPTPVYSEGIVYVASGFRGSALHAISLNKAKGDISNTEAILWQHNKNTPYVPSPLLFKNRLYFTRINKNILSCFDAKTGKPLFESVKLEDIKGIYASPVAANNQIYIAGRNGVTYVIKPGETFEIMAKNILDDNFDASPAIIGNELFLRGHKYLYCIKKANAIKSLKD